MSVLCRSWTSRLPVVLWMGSASSLSCCETNTPMVVSIETPDPSDGSAREDEKEQGPLEVSHQVCEKEESQSCSDGISIILTVKDAELKQWDVELKRKRLGDASLGVMNALTTDRSQHLEIVRIASRLLEFNQRVPEAQRVKVKDRIVSVNGQTGNMLVMREALKKDRVRMCLVRFPEEFEVFLKRQKNQNFGIVSSVHGISPPKVYIKRVAEDSIVCQHNSRVIEDEKPHLVVTKGLRILSVNGEQDAHEIMSLLGDSKFLLLRLGRV